MKKITYRKLVRDKIPTIIKQAGKTYTCRILTDEDYLTFLDEKLNEELAEYQESKSMEELSPGSHPRNSHCARQFPGRNREHPQSKSTKPRRIRKADTA